MLEIFKTKSIPTLKYKWVAGYSDGTRLEQNAEDVSTIDAKRSAFFDVDHERLDWFALSGEHNGVPRAWAVDLRDGHFEIDGNVFTIGDEIVMERKLYFFRRNLVQKEVDTVIGEDLQPHVTDVRDLPKKVWYRLGWSGRGVDGKPIEHFIEFE